MRGIGTVLGNVPRAAASLGDSRIRTWRRRSAHPQTIERGKGEAVTVLKLARHRSLPLWMIPTSYVVASVVAGLTVPRLEHAFLAGRSIQGMSAAAEIAWLSAVASGSMAFTGVVFAVAFVVVQFGAVAYSPRVVTMFAGMPRIYHTLGLFFATFIYALAVLLWTDRQSSGFTPPVSTYLVGILLVASMLAFARLVQAVQEMQIQIVLQTVGSRGRVAIANMPPGGDAEVSEESDALADLPPARRTFTYSGEPLAVAELDIDCLVGVARAAEAVIVVECAVGDTLLDGAVVMRVHGGEAPLADRGLRQAIRLTPSRTFAQDPKYAIRLLVDVAIRALSPAVNDPTTAVQALDQIEDLLRRLGRRRLDGGWVRDQSGAARVVFPAPSWNDYLSLSFDEIRQFGAQSLQVTRRLRAALTGLADSVPAGGRHEAILRCLDHLDASVERSEFDAQDRAAGMQEDRQGLGLAGHRAS